MRILVTLACVLGVFVTSTNAQTKNVTIIGEVIDIVSYMTTGMKPDSPEGKEILNASLSGGNPLGVLEDKTGRVYVVTMKQASTSSNETLKLYVGQRIAAKGDVYQKGGSRVLVMSVIGKSIK